MSLSLLPASPMPLCPHGSSSFHAQSGAGTHPQCRLWESILELWMKLVTVFCGFCSPCPAQQCQPDPADACWALRAGRIMDRNVHTSLWIPKLSLVECRIP